MQEYSEKFKRKMVQRMSGPMPTSATALSTEVGVAQATLRGGCSPPVRSAA